MSAAAQEPSLTAMHLLALRSYKKVRSYVAQNSERSWL